MNQGLGGLTSCSKELDMAMLAVWLRQRHSIIPVSALVTYLEIMIYQTTGVQSLAAVLALEAWFVVHLRIVRAFQGPNTCNSPFFPVQIPVLRGRLSCRRSYRAVLRRT